MCCQSAPKIVYNFVDDGEIILCPMALFLSTTSKTEVSFYKNIENRRPNLTSISEIWHAS
jgi:hypothetical protein